MEKLKKRQKFRLGLLLTLLMLLPIVFGYFSPVLFIYALLTGVAAFGLFLFPIWGLSSLLFSRSFQCAYTCPWGAIQEFYGHVVNQKKAKSKIGSYAKYPAFLLWFGTIIYALGRAREIKEINLLYPGKVFPDHFISVSLPEVLVIYVLIVGIIAFFTIMLGSRAYCRYLCSMGVPGIIGTRMNSLLKWWPAYHLEEDKSKCVKCGKCSEVCSMGLEVCEMVQKENMYNPDCIQCAACADVCPTGAIRTAWKWNKKKSSGKTTRIVKKDVVKSTEDTEDE